MSEPTKTSAGTYAVEMICTNCGAKAKQAFTKGKSVPAHTECPTCGCVTMIKNYAANNELAKCMDVFFNGRSAD